MKRSSTFHLESDIYDIMDAYKKKYGLTSRNDALTRMLIEYRTITNFNINQYLEGSDEQYEEEMGNNIVKKNTDKDVENKTNSQERIEDNTESKGNNIVKNETNSSDEKDTKNTKSHSEISNVISNVYENMPD